MMPATVGSRRSTNSDYAAMVAGLDKLFADMTAAGERVPSSTRFHQYRPMLMKLRNGAIDPDDRAFWNVAHHAVNETTQLLKIAAVLQDRSIPGWGKHVLQCLDGPPTPMGSKEVERLPGTIALGVELGFFGGEVPDETTHLVGCLSLPISDLFERAEAKRDPPQAQQHDPGRAFQFEKYAAVHFAEAGFAIVLDEPDTQITVPNLGRVGLASKMVKSLKKVQDNLSDGAKQIASQQLQGLVALDFTIAFDLHRKIFFIDSLEDAQRFHAPLGVALRERVGSHVAEWVQRSSKGQATRGVVGHATILLYERKSETLGSLHEWFMGPVWAPDAIGWDFLRSTINSRT